MRQAHGAGGQARAGERVAGKHGSRTNERRGPKGKHAQSTARRAGARHRRPTGRPKRASRRASEHAEAGQPGARSGPTAPPRRQAAARERALQAVCTRAQRGPNQRSAHHRGAPP
eukprot:8561666-Alexandrium_andersonii.AAC.1